jgi:MFS family permease
LTLYLVVLASVLTSIAQRGSKVTLSLYALDLGAGSFAVGLLGALYASFPLILAVHAGRISDRFGVRYPMLLGGIIMALALAIPAVYPSLPILFVSGALMGLGHIFFHVSVHNLVGSLGTARKTSPPFRSAARSPPSSVRRLRGSASNTLAFAPRSSSSPSRLRCPQPRCSPTARHPRAGNLRSVRGTPSTCSRFRTCDARSS